MYAVLKEYFPVLIDIKTTPFDVSELKEFLEIENPSAKSILKLSRFAVDDTFVGLDFQLNGFEIISIIPPSSGG